MRVLLQRVLEASVTVDGTVVGEIGPGLVAFVGVETGDTMQDVDYLVDKVVNMRIFTDEAGKFNNSVLTVKGSLLVVSQFTLLADTHKGRRPNFIAAADPSIAEPLCITFIERARAAGLTVASGRFQQHMLVKILNDGPVTIFLDSKEKFTENRL
ncbi:MAG TPA: D-tyrosyl-tRNA(Tyr) deacylase [Dehalococcoidia bacterium]|nr:D-tyrosyl-tRNA(Tyr) deacylase [Dehalococcoidia bacterium]